MINKSILFFSILLSGFHSEAQPKLYVYIVSHNEDNIGYLNGITGRNNYLNARTGLINLCNMVQAKNLAYDYGADHVALRAIARYDTGSVITNTNTKNLVKWMKEDRNVMCDPHSHETTFNYADVAYLMSQLGVMPSNTMSGFLYNQLQNGNSWEDYQNGVTGDSIPAFTWYPEILWGAGSPNHVNDPQYFGVYRPLSISNFTTHEPSNHLILCGTGCNLKLTDTSTVAYKFAQIKNTVDALQNGTLPQTGIYMQEIFFSEGNVDDPWFYPMIDALTDSINGLVNTGKAEWKNISDIVDIWKNTFNNQPFAMDCSFNVILQPTSITEADNGWNGILIYPNPSGGGILQLTFENNFSGNRYVITDLAGKVVLENEITNTTMMLDIPQLASGVYFLSANNCFRKFVKL